MQYLPPLLSRWPSYFSLLLRHHLSSGYSLGRTHLAAFYSGAPAMIGDCRDHEQQSQDNKRDYSEVKQPTTSNSGAPHGKNKVEGGPWRPLKRLSRREMNHMRELKELQPEEWSNERLGRVFGVSGSAVRRILKSRFEPSSEVEERQERRVEEQRRGRRGKGQVAGVVDHTSSRLGDHSQSHSEH